jgi:nucleoside-diphosphate-sugar epimerase
MGNKMNILVTGSSGFIGSRVAERLRAKHNVVTCDRNGGDLWMAVQDLSDCHLVGIDVVLHFAGQPLVQLAQNSPRWSLEQNVGATVHMLELCTEKRFMLSGYANEFGAPSYPITEEAPIMPHSIYSFTKAAQELAALAFQRTYSMNVAILAAGAIVGPGMHKEMFLYRWLRNIMEDKPVTLLGGDQTRDITYIDDVVDAWELALEANAAGKYLVTYGEEHPVSELLEMCFQVCGKRVPVERLNHRTGEKGQREWYSHRKALETFGYTPKVSPLESVQRTAEWVRSTL